MKKLKFGDKCMWKNHKCIYMGERPFGHVMVYLVHKRDNWYSEANHAVLDKIKRGWKS